MSDNPYAPPQAKPTTAGKTSSRDIAARILIQLFWIVFITLGSMGLIALGVVSSIKDPIQPQQLGYITGRYTLWVFIAAVFLVRLAAIHGWLPGIPAKHKSVSNTDNTA